ncbi:MAG: aldolase [Acidobacteriia bacterium]|nr:aldolase [Terriglobia bacterium]
MPDSFILTAITADPEIVRAADRAGVDRIGIDIERIGKQSRQGHLREARFAAHQLEDLAQVTATLKHARVFARLNPFYDQSRHEIETALALGAQVLMLPYFQGPAEVAAFLDIVAGRAAVVPLLETAAAARRVQEIAALAGLQEIMVGLNDLSLSLGLSSPFEAVALPLMTRIAQCVRGAGLRFGFGGLARVTDASLPVHPDLVCAQYARLGATSAWLARSFYRGLRPEQIAPAVDALRDRLREWSGQPAAVLEEQRDLLAQAVQPAFDRL